MPRFFHTLLLGCLLVAGSACLMKVERVCETAAQCTGYAKPHTCYEGSCVPQVCPPDPQKDKPQPCYCIEGKGCQHEPVGGCKQGLRFCIHNGAAWSACIGQQLPVTEFCDGVDNDCDGKTDEDLDCQCKPHQLKPCSMGIDPDSKGCHGGVQRCIYEGDKWRWSPCQGHIQSARISGQLSGSALRRCAYHSASCEDPKAPLQMGCACDPSKDAPRPCYTGPEDTLKPGSPCQRGQQQCIKVSDTLGHWGPCENEVLPTSEFADPKTGEACNGVDDDCDGKTDNIPGTDAPLLKRCDDGECTSQICLANGTWGLCDTWELCGNRQDDDCDGQIDEQKDGNHCCQRVELCGNQRDDNCDGTVDESDCKKP